MNSKTAVKTIIIMIFVVGALMGFYFHLTSRNKAAVSAQHLEDTAVKEMTKVQKILSGARYKEYPPTPVQVVKYYNEITQCFYNESYSSEELMSLAVLSRSLFDDELKAQQTDVDYRVALEADIDTFKAGNITIHDSVVSPSTEVEYFTHDGHECARLYCTYSLKSGNTYTATKEVFILRKDEENHWKIFGFDLAEDKNKQE